jgi:hypothetical protein
MTHEESKYVFWFNLGYDDCISNNKRVLATDILNEAAYKQGYTAAEEDKLLDDVRADR